MSIKSLTVRDQQGLPVRPSLFAALAGWARAGAERSRQRRALAQLNDFDLRDIGLTRSDAAGEAAKPFWRA
jgi:uncharacterized protein YjiS (DUF1127 family)